MLLKIVYLLMCRVLGLAVLVFRGDRAKDAELLVLRHENAVLRRHVSRVRYEPDQQRVSVPAYRGRCAGRVPGTDQLFGSGGVGFAFEVLEVAGSQLAPRLFRVANEGMHGVTTFPLARGRPASTAPERVRFLWSGSGPRLPAL